MPGNRRGKKKKNPEEIRQYNRERQRERRKRFTEEQLAAKRDYDKKYKQEKIAKGEWKHVANLNPREVRKVRRQTKERTRRCRERKQLAINVLNSSPNSPECNAQANFLNVDQLHERTGFSRKVVGRKRKNRSRAKVYYDLMKAIKREETQKKRAERYKKRYQRLKKKLQALSTPSPNSKIQALCGTIKVPTPVKRKLVFSEILTKHLTEKRKEINKNQKKLNEFSQLISPKDLKKKKLVGKASPFLSYKMYRKVLGKCERKKSLKTVSNAMIVRAFLEQDINSRMCPGKKETATKNKVKVQKRVLLDSLKNLHIKFLREYKIKMSYTLFRKLRPFHIVQPKLSDRETCLCIEHANMTLVTDKLYYLNVLPTNSLTKLLQIACCSTKRKKCMYRQCRKCISKFTVDLQNFDILQPVLYRQWVKKGEERTIKKQLKVVNITTKESYTCSLKELVDIFWEKFYTISCHVFDIHHQFRSLKDYKESMKKNEIIVHMDFSENYVTKYASEPQAVHFGASKKQLSLHTVVCYNEIFNNGIQSFCTVSSNLDHAAYGVWAHLEPVLTSAVEVNPEINTIHFLSDGPSSQYKNKNNIYLLLHKLPNLLPNIKQWTWNFSISGHGKGPMDGIGGTIKRLADSVVLQGQDVTNTKELIDKVAPLCKRIKLMEVKLTDINKWESYIPPKPPLLKGIQKAHQIVWQKHNPSRLEIRSLSCADCKFKFCTHFQIVNGYILFMDGRSKIIQRDEEEQLVDNLQDLTDDIQPQRPDDAQEKLPDDDHQKSPDDAHEKLPDDDHQNSPDDAHEKLPDDDHQNSPDDVHEKLPDDDYQNSHDDVHEKLPDDDHQNSPDDILPQTPGVARQGKDNHPCILKSFHQRKIYRSFKFFCLSIPQIIDDHIYPIVLIVL